VLVLALTTPIVQMTKTFPDSGKVIRLGGYGLLLALQIILIANRGLSNSIRVLLTPLAAPIAWFVISLIWTENFGISTKRVFLIVLVYISIFISLDEIKYRKSMDILRAALVFMLAFNFVSVFAYPDVAIHPEGGQWRGLMAHKNIAGMASAVTVLLFALDGKHIPRLIRGGVIISGLLFLYQTWSRTAVIAIVVALPVGLVMSSISPKTKSWVHRHDKSIAHVVWTITAAVFLGLIFLTLQRDLFVSFTDDATTLSLRNSIWRPMLQFYLDHPILGSGYGAYWDSSIKNISAFSTQRWLGSVDQGHNGYLDILVQTGLPGLIFGLCAVFTWPAIQMGTMLVHQASRAGVIFALIFFFLIENCTESSLLDGDVLGNVFFLFALAHVHRFALRSSQPKPTRGQPSAKIPA
jgi:O-antigen ligase